MQLLAKKEIESKPVREKKRSFIQCSPSKVESSSAVCAESSHMERKYSRATLLHFCLPLSLSFSPAAREYSRKKVKSQFSRLFLSLYLLGLCMTP